MINPDLAYKAWLDIWNRDRNRLLTKEIDAVSEATRNLPGIKQTLDQYDRYQNWQEEGKAKQRAYNEQKGGFHAFLNRVEDGTNLAHQALGMPIEAVSRVTNIDPRAIGAAAAISKIPMVPRGSKVYKGIQSLKTKKPSLRKKQPGSIDVEAFDPSTRIVSETSGTLMKTHPGLFGKQKQSYSFAMAKDAKRVGKKQTIKEAIAEAVKETGTRKSISSKNDALSKLPPKEIERRITAEMTVQQQADVMKNKGGDTYKSRRAGGSGPKVFEEKPDVKIAAGLQRESPGIMKEYGAKWDSPVEQAHHWFQKDYMAAVKEQMIIRMKEKGSDITWYDIANIEAKLQEMGISGIGDSGVGGVPEAIHNLIHSKDRTSGREPTGGMPLSDADMTPKQLKAEKLKIERFNKKYKETGIDEESFYPGPSLGVLKKNLKKLKTADQFTQEVIGAAEEIYIPQMNKMKRLTEAARDDFPELQRNVVTAQMQRDDIKAIRRGAEPNPENLSDLELAKRKAVKDKEYRKSRTIVQKSASKIAKGRHRTKTRKAELSFEQVIKDAYPEYDSILIERARDIWDHVNARSGVHWPR